METSEKINELAGALAKAQGQIEGAAKDMENPFLKSKYADLSSVWAVARKPLSDNELCVVQTPENCDNGNVTLRTTLFHSSGQWIASVLEMPVAKQEPQGYGSAISYARRYSLASMVGIYSEDDDGEGAKPGKEINYEIPEKAIEYLKSIVNLILLKDACSKYQNDYKTGQTGWTKKDWNGLCKVMAEMKHDLENEVIKDIDPDNVKDNDQALKESQAKVVDIDPDSIKIPADPIEDEFSQVKKAAQEDKKQSLKPDF